MKKAELSVVKRESNNKSYSRKLRNEGLVPAVVYGPGLKNQNCAFDSRSIHKIFQGSSYSNFILTLKSDEKTLDGKKVLLKEVSRDPLGWKPLHADLYEISMDRPLTVKIPIDFEGTPTGVKLDGGILQIVRRAVELRALPGDIPEKISLDISGLNIGDSFHVSDLNVGEKVTILDSEGYTLASVVEQEVEKIEAPAEAEAAEGEEGEAAEGEAAEGSEAASSEDKKPEE